MSSLDRRRHAIHGRSQAFAHHREHRAIVQTMPAHATGSGTISFGLVSIPVKLYTAAASQSVSFNLLHAKCGSRIKLQNFCPVCNEVVDRAALVRGYEFAKDQYVRVGDEELKGLEGEASKVIDIAEFVPLTSVDPIYFEKTYYLGPDKGGEKAYRLLADAMGAHGRVALAKFVMRGKESLVLIRPAQGGLMLHTMYFADEVRSFGEIEKGESAKIKEGELALALQLIDGLSSDAFNPEKYRDEYRERVLELVNQKVEGKEVTAAGPQVQRAQVIDLMEALKQSLAKRAAAPPALPSVAPAAAAEKKPLAKAKRAEPVPAKKAQAGKK
ncbi:MAG: Ku protein [Candidatus Rokuibacteriota bacterium]|nr:MAG: Ku protein [Candidatus Rokubacteria bacterium]PYN70681.1 MAG: Ku protein [Candidatus Rokubacteria bacterium]